MTAIGSVLARSTGMIEVLPMTHKAKNHPPQPKAPGHPLKPLTTEHKSTLALVIKGDSDGCEQAICDMISHHTDLGIPIEIIHQGVGDICKTDIMTAATASHLVLGFNVNVLPKITELCLEQNVEIRLYSVIYKLDEDVKDIAHSLLPRPVEEKLLGRAKVITLFKGSRQGIILGCEVEQGRLQRGDAFRIIAAMGPIYSGKISSLHIEKDAVNKATPGQQVGVKIDGFKNVRVGDLVECYQVMADRHPPRWRPSGKIIHL